MQTKKILSRKDGYSVVVAIVLALALNSFLSSYGYFWANKLTVPAESNMYGPDHSSDWKVNYLQPLIVFLIQVVLLEVIIQAIGYVNSNMRTTKKKR